MNDNDRGAFVEMVAQQLFALPRPRRQEEIDAAMPEMVSSSMTWADLRAIAKRWAQLERAAGYVDSGKYSAPRAIS